MEGTVAQSIVDPDNPEDGALGARHADRQPLGAGVPARRGKPFSIREWISDEDRDGFLFLTSRGDQHASLRGLISTWLEIAVNAMLSLAQEPDRRIWVILDELPTLHQVPSLQPGLAESRQFGGCFVLGVQVASALRDLYGRNGAETISGLCGTRVVLAAPDRDTAQWSADSLGRSEIEEVAEGYSYGANTIRDGVSLTPRRELRALALPSEIMRLENLSGYLKFPGPFPVASIRLRYVSRPKAAERFVPRKGDRTESRSPVGEPGNPPETPPAAPAGDDAIAIPDPRGEAGTGPGEPPPEPADAPHPPPLQCALDLVPLPGEAARAETDAGPDANGAAPKKGRKRPAREAETAEGGTSKTNGEAPPADRKTAEPATSEPGPAPDDKPAAPDAGPDGEWL